MKRTKRDLFLALDWVFVDLEKYCQLAQFEKTLLKTLSHRRTL